MRGQPGHNKRLYARLPPGFLGMDVWKTLELNVVLSRKLTWFLIVFGSFSRDWQTSGRLVQKLNACTVHFRVDVRLRKSENGFPRFPYVRREALNIIYAAKLSISRHYDNL